MIKKHIVCDAEGCGKEMVYDSQDFLTVLGNIYVGSSDIGGGIIGNNLDGTEVYRSAHYCWLCFELIIKQAKEDAKTCKEY